MVTTRKAAEEKFRYSNPVFNIYGPNAGLLDINIKRNKNLKEGKPRPEAFLIKHSQPGTQTLLTSVGLLPTLPRPLVQENNVIE